MEKTDRRELIALDQAYDFYRELVQDGSTHDLHRLVNSLKTVDNALDAAQNGHMDLTLRLWQKIRQALFDNLLTQFSAHVVAIAPDGRVLTNRDCLPDDCILELYPEGLRRTDDVFECAIEDLHPVTRERLERVWRERGPSTRRDDFVSAREESGSCEGGVCTMKPNTFIVGADVLTAEAKNGRERAYQDYWRLYWQSYCSPRAKERQHLTNLMASLEAVWGNLHY